MTQIDSNMTAGLLAAELEAARAENVALKRQVESAQQKLTSMDATPDPIFSLTPDGRYAYANQALADAYGTSVEDIIGKGLWDFFPKEAADRRFASLSHAYRTGGDVSVEEPVPRAGGDRYYATTIRPIKDAVGNVVSTICSSRDITDRKRAEEALQASEVRYSSLFRLLSSGVVVTDDAGQIVDANPAAEHILGLTRSEAVERTFDSPAWSIVRPDGTPMPADEYASVRAMHEGRTVDNVEMGILQPNGTLRWLLTSASPVPAKRLGVCITFTDITERKAAEEALRLSSERLQLATRVANIGIWDWDIVKNELVWDDSMYQLYGIRRGDFGEAYDAWIRTIHPEDKAHAEVETQAALRGEREFVPEFRIVRPDGSIRYMKADSKTSRDQDGKPLRMIGTNIDITERKQAEDELRRQKDTLEATVQQRTTELLLARDAAEAANKAKSVFLANMSHELRTPMNAILGFSNMLSRDPQLTANQRENLDIINRSGEHLLSLINDVLEVAKIEAGRLQLEIAPFDLGGMVRDVTEMMQIRAQEKGLRLLLDQSSEFSRYIKGDEARIRQIIINLINNAVKFTEQGGVTLRLGVKNNARQHLLIEVEDTGSSIAPEDRQRLFEPFVQLTEGGAQQGTGLGLTITRQFVQMMGGSIAVESTLGKGSLFRVELPVEMASAANMLGPATPKLEEVVGLAPGQPRYRIMIVDDQRENQLLLSRLMTDIDLDVKVVENGQQCLELFQDWRPDLIWMDRRMPVMDGIEATKHLRSLPDGQNVKIVAVTASAFKEQQQEMLDAGMDDFVRKPYRFEEIYDCMARQLGVQYLYTDAQPTEPDTLQLTTEMLSILPQELRNELIKALKSLEQEHISTVIGQVLPYDLVLYKTLSQLAENFDYPTILNALRATLSANET
jgi:PAS domain S-box-containing protein